MSRDAISLLYHPFGVMLLDYYRELLVASLVRPLVSTCSRSTTTAATSVAGSNDTNDVCKGLYEKLQPELTELLEAQFSGSNVCHHDDDTDSDTSTTSTQSTDSDDDNDSTDSQSESRRRWSKKSEQAFVKKMTEILQNHCVSLETAHQRDGEGEVLNWVYNEASKTCVGMRDITVSTQTNEVAQTSDEIEVVTNEKSDGQDEDRNDKENSDNRSGVAAIVKVSVNRNDRVRKVAQALEYAKDLCKPKLGNEEYAIVWTLHLYDLSTQQTSISNKRNFDQLQGEQHSTSSQQPKQKQTWKEMEVRVYLSDLSWDTSKSAKAASNADGLVFQSEYAMVWRECTVISDGTSDNTQIDVPEERQRRQENLQEGARSMVRAVAMVAKLAEWKKDKTHERIFKSWKLKGPNCAKVSFRLHPGKHFMLKGFDNRFAPTAESPYMWCDKSLYDPRLEVEPYFLLHEGCVDGSTKLDTHSYSRQSQDCDPAVAAGQADTISNKVRETIRSLSEDGRLVNEADHLSSADSCTSSSRVVLLLGNPRPPRDDAAVYEKYRYGVPFGLGTVVILRYKYIEGSHWPGYTMSITGEDGVAAGAGAGAAVARGAADISEGTAIVGAATYAKSVCLGSPRCFLPILDRLKIIHEKGYVHGDVRLFNMIFPVSSPQHGDSDGDAVLLDYDLGGKEGARRLEASSLPVLRKSIGGLKETKSKKTGMLKAMQQLNIDSMVNGDTQSSLQAEITRTQSEIDALEDQCNEVEKWVEEWDGRLSDLDELINEEKGKSGPDLSNAMKSLKELLNYDVEVMRSLGTDTQLDLGLYLVVRVTELEDLFNKARKKKKIEVATGSPDRHLKNPRGTEATLKGQKGGT